MKYIISTWPPSVNQMYRAHAGRVLLSERARKFYRLALAELARQGLYKPLQGDISLRVWVYPPDRRKRDIDNIQKSIFDLLTKAAVIVDDSQICRFHVENTKIVEPGGKILIEISGYEQCTSKEKGGYKEESDKEIPAPAASEVCH